MSYTLEDWKHDFGTNNERNLRNFGIASATYVKCVDSPLGNTFYYILNDLNDYDKNKIIKAIEKCSLVERHELRFVEKPKDAHFGIFYADREQTLDLGDCLADTGLYRWILGKDINGDYVDLDMRKIPHLLIGGTSGSGKSVLIHNIIFNILNCYTLKQNQGWFEMLIIDPKGTELNMYKDVQNTEFVDNVEQAIKTLKEWVVGMDLAYSGKVEQPHPCERFIIIDELADLMLRSKYEVEDLLVRIAQKGRAIGIHLIVATQTPRVSVISGLIKANMPERIALRTASATDSMVLLDHKGAESLEGQGDCILRLNGKERRCLVAMPSEENKKTLIKYCDKRG